MRTVNDMQLWAALLAAPLIWLTLLFVSGQSLTLYWTSYHSWTFLKLVLVLPVLEELVFRGWLQGFLQQCTTKRWGVISAANFLTSLLFSGMHFLFHAPLWAVSVIIPSLLFGYFRERHSSLSTPILLHVFYNAGYFLFFPPVLQ